MRGEGWVADLELDPSVDGRRRRRYLYGKTQRDVLDRLASLRTQRDHGLPITAARGMTLVQYLDSWVDGTLAHQLKPAVLRDWLATLRRTRNARGRAYSSRSVQIAHGVLRRALTDAVRDDLIPRNVALLVKPGRVDSPAPQPLRPEEIRALLTEVTPSGRRRGRLAEVPPKTAGSIRRIALPAVLVDALAVHRQQQGTEREAASYWGDDDLVFTSSIGTWLEPQNVYKAWHELCERADVRRCRPHDYADVFVMPTSVRRSLVSGVSAAVGSA